MANMHTRNLPTSLWKRLNFQKPGSVTFMCLQSFGVGFGSSLRSAFTSLTTSRTNIWLLILTCLVAVIEQLKVRKILKSLQNENLKHFVSASPLITLTALGLMTVQCSRRFIESNFLQIFSKKSKINLSHYLCGFMHYYGVFVLICAKGDGFIGGKLLINILDARLTRIFLGQSTSTIEFKAFEVALSIASSIIFIYFWWKQYESNMIFINLRRNKTGAVVTETHLIPRGGLFEYVSSPHMTSEVAMYATLYVLLHQNSSYIYCFAWVISNQFSNALLTHRWYKETFSDYPKQRKAFIPFFFWNVQQCWNKWNY